jgi:hypothetical protein
VSTVVVVIDGPALAERIVNGSNLLQKADKGGGVIKKAGGIR